MSHVELLTTVHSMSRAEKIQLIQILANDLALEEEIRLDAGGIYPIWSPRESEEAAQTLLDLLAGQGAAE